MAFFDDRDPAFAKSLAPASRSRLQVSNLALVLDLLEERDQSQQEIDDLRVRLGHWEPR